MWFIDIHAMSYSSISCKYNWCVNSIFQHSLHCSIVFYNWHNKLYHLTQLYTVSTWLLKSQTLPFLIYTDIKLPILLLVYYWSLVLLANLLTTYSIPSAARWPALHGLNTQIYSFVFFNNLVYFSIAVYIIAWNVLHNSNTTRISMHFWTFHPRSI